MSRVLTQEKLKELLDYDETTGVFTRKIRTANAIQVGDIAGCMRPDGRFVISLENKRYFSHRLAWLYVYGFLPEMLDHIDGNPSNNKINNLRSCTSSQNQENQRKPQTSNKCGFLGVSYKKRINKFISQIQIDGVVTHLGCFSTPEDAHQAYLIAKRGVHVYCTI
jgi:hypothetical protein